MTNESTASKELGFGSKKGLCLAVAFHSGGEYRKFGI